MRFSFGQGIILFLLSFVLVQTGCQQSGPPSVLIIALDDFQVNDLRCTQDQMTMSGFRILCDDFIRFTHAFTTSTLTVPALASVLTGQLPYETELHDNASYLKRSHLTLAETVHARKYRTSFFSGGAPVFRKTGLGQGFEYFDDHLQFEYDRFFRPFKQNSYRFTSWLDRLGSHESFLSVIYGSDLKFQFHQTMSTSGELRSQNIESQIEEVSEVLADLFQKIRGLGRWNNSLIVVTGLSGRPLAQHEFTNNKLPPPLQLHSHDMQVVLFIKPPSKARDQMATWKVDRNVSLIDLAPTIEDIIGIPNSPTENRRKYSQSLTSLLQNKALEAHEDRMIILESGWANWHYNLPLRFAFLKNEYLFFNDQNPAIFNTFVDHLEIFPMKGKDIDGSAIFQEFSEFAKTIEKVPFPTKRFFELSAQIEGISYSAWLGSTPEPELYDALQKILRVNPNKQAQDWAFRLALEKRNWPELEKLGREFKDDGALYTALVNQKKITALPTEKCLPYVTSPPKDLGVTKNCSDSLMQPIFFYLVENLNDPQESDAARKKVEALIYELYLSSRIIQTDYALGRLWDLSPGNRVRPQLAEYALHLPQLNRLRIQALNSIFTQSRGPEKAE